MRIACRFEMITLDNSSTANDDTLAESRCLAHISKFTPQCFRIQAWRSNQKMIEVYDVVAPPDRPQGSVLKW